MRQGAAAAFVVGADPRAAAERRAPIEQFPIAGSHQSRAVASPIVSRRTGMSYSTS